METKQNNFADGFPFFVTAKANTLFTISTPDAFGTILPMQNFSWDPTWDPTRDPGWDIGWDPDVGFWNGIPPGIPGGIPEKI